MYLSIYPFIYLSIYLYIYLYDTYADAAYLNSFKLVKLFKKVKEAHTNIGQEKRRLSF